MIFPMKRFKKPLPRPQSTLVRGPGETRLRAAKLQLNTGKLNHVASLSMGIKDGSYFSFLKTHTLTCTHFFLE